MKRDIGQEILDGIRAIKRGDDWRVEGDAPMPDIGLIRKRLCVDYATLGKMLDVEPLRIEVWEKSGRVDDEMARRMLWLMTNPKDDAPSSAFLRPRTFDDVEVPRRNGRLLLVASGDSYDFYLDWLADHLPKAYAGKMQRTDESNLNGDVVMARILGEEGALHIIYCVEPFEALVEAGAEYEEAVLHSWASMLGTVGGDLREEDFDSYFYDSLTDWISPEIWKNAIREVREMAGIEAKHADIGYRDELAFRMLPHARHEDRRAVLDGFYQSFMEAMSK